ncbi:MAG: phosphotransferase [Deltaproteobacteria bacterium]|nr:phosphotransferase [Deltaproteobacteria bacterium]
MFDNLRSPEIIHFVEAHLNTSCEHLNIIKLAGDASDRQYFRLSYKNKTWILLQREPFEPSRDPYLNIQTHLQKNDIHVPQIYAVSGNLGAFLIEDFGDELLDKVYRHLGPKAAAKYYFLALDELLKFHIDASSNLEGCVATKHRLDEKKFLAELEFMKEHLIQNHLQKKISPEENKVLQTGFQKISSHLNEEPLCLCHRDYHSKNLLMTKQRIGIVDFQDARLGPCHYDVASLLRDSYIQLPEPLVEDLLKYYLFEKEQRLKKPLSYEAFVMAFDWVSIQRNLKAMGSFGYLKTVKQKSQYLEYLKPTWISAQKNLKKFKELEAFHEVLENLFGDL